MSLNARPERIFISVNESTGRSTLSFAPPDVGTPILHEQDGKGALALVDAKAICEKYPGCTIHGPYFHAARPSGLKKSYRKAPHAKSKANE
jgi:hypothetical protein